MRVGPPHVLLMDDERDFRRDYQDILSRGNRLLVKLAPNPTRARSLIKEKPFDAAVLDIMMPTGTQGLEIIEEFRSSSPYLYLEVVTGYPEFREAALKKGADRILIKPLKFKKDVERIRNGVLRKRLRRLEDITHLDLNNQATLTAIAQNTPIGNDLLFELDVLAGNLMAIQERLAEQAEHHKIAKAEIPDLFHDIAHYLVANTLDSYCNNGNNYSSVLPLDNNKTKDVNLERLNQQRDELMHIHSGEYVAIVGGKIVDFDQDIERLIHRIADIYPGQERMIHHLLNTEREVKIRGPRLRMTEDK